MRHRNQGRKLNVTTSHRIAMLADMGVGGVVGRLSIRPGLRWGKAL